MVLPDFEVFGMRCQNIAFRVYPTSFYKTHHGIIVYIRATCCWGSALSHTWFVSFPGDPQTTISFNLSFSPFRSWSEKIMLCLEAVSNPMMIFSTWKNVLWAASLNYSPAACIPTSYQVRLCESTIWGGQKNWTPEIPCKPLVITWAPWRKWWEYWLLVS